MDWNSLIKHRECTVCRTSEISRINVRSDAKRGIWRHIWKENISCGIIGFPHRRELRPLENTKNANKSLHIRLHDDLKLLWSVCKKSFGNDIKHQKRRHNKIIKFCAENWKESTYNALKMPPKWCINNIKYTFHMWAKIAWKHLVCNEKAHIRPLKITWSKLLQNAKDF